MLQAPLGQGHRESNCRQRTCLLPSSLPLSPLSSLPITSPCHPLKPSSLTASLLYIASPPLLSSLLPAPPPDRSAPLAPSLPKAAGAQALQLRVLRPGAASAAGFSQHHPAHAWVLKSNTGLELRAEERGGRSGKNTKQLAGSGRGSTAHLAGGFPWVSGWAAAP